MSNDTQEFKADDGLTNKQRMFCHEYIVDLNMTQAAIRAGYSKTSAHDIGSENLKKPEIKKKVDALMAERAKRTEITADRVLNELAKIGFADVRRIFNDADGLLKPSGIDDITAAAIQSIEVVSRPSAEVDEDGNREIEYVHKIKLTDKKGALELLGKNLKMFTDKHELTGAGGGPIVTANIEDGMDPQKAADIYSDFMRGVKNSD